jgi:hypothetical protein
MKCDSCALWITRRATAYDDGTEIDTYRAPDGRGRCQLLEIDVAAEFGCNRFSPAVEPSVRITHKTGAPWQHWVMGDCPDCVGKGNQNDGACHRCAGTSRVRHYEDGHVGEERTRLHPREREAAAKPKCAGCGRDVEPDWMACPRCAHRLDGIAPTEKVDDPLFPK